VIHVADTHAFIWLLTGQERRLGRAATRVVERASRGLGELRVSAASLHELSRLLERGRIRTPHGWSWWLARLRETAGIATEPVTVDDVDAARAFTMLDDPFDRLVAGTAVRLEAPLLTADERIAKSSIVDVVW
jgi:PIN domain nuclease of toxin-antitoxin system